MSVDGDKDMATSIDLPLGFHPVLRLRAHVETRASLVATTPAVTIETKKGTLSLKGKCSNLAQTFPCQLKWLVEPEDAAAFTVLHPAKTVLVPAKSGGPLKDIDLEIKQVGDSGLTALGFDVFKMGLYGRGRIGATVMAEVPGLAPLELLPSGSGISYNTPLTLSVEGADGHPWSLQAANHASVGAAFTVKVAAGPLFHGLALNIRWWEEDEIVAEDEDDDGASKTPSGGAALHWQLDEIDDSQTLRLGIGNAEDVPQFWYATAPETEANLNFCWEVTIEESSGARVPGARAVRKGTFCTAAIPKLTNLELTKLPSEPSAGDDLMNCGLSGTFTGFSHEFSFPMATRLYLHTPPETGGPSSRPHIESLGNEVPLSVDAGGTFRAALTLDSSAVQRVRSFIEGKIFAVLSFPHRSGANGQGRPVFMSVAQYQANAGGAQGFVPFRDGSFSSEIDGFGVCTDLLGITGEVTDLKSDGHVYTDWKNGFRKNIADQNRFNEYILASAREFDVDPLILKSLIAQESEFKTDACRPSGSYAGLTQVSKDIAGRAGCTEFGAPNGVDHRFDADKAIRAGALGLSEKRNALVKALAERITTLPEDERYRLYVAAYNLGQGTVLNTIRALGEGSIEWRRLVAVEIIDPTEDHRVLSSNSPLGKAILAQGWKDKMVHIRHYVEDMIARARQESAV